jgi:BASS family bile acid:Na+ symporter
VKRVRFSVAEEIGTRMDTAKLLGLALQASIVLTVVGFGLTTTQQDATYLLRNPKLLARAVLSMNIVMPIIAATLVSMFVQRFEVKVALVALAVSPVPPIVQKSQLTAGGRREYVAGLLVAMSLLAVVLVPLTVHLFDWLYDRHGVVTPLAVAKIMLITVLAPLLIGLAFRRWIPGAERASGAILGAAGILLAVGAVFILYGLWPVIKGFLGNGIVWMLALLAIIGLAVGHVLGGPLAGDRTVLATATSSRHPAVALAIATSGPLMAAKPELAIILLYLIVATIIGIPYKKWRARTAGKVAHIKASGA